MKKLMLLLAAAGLFSGCVFRIPGFKIDIGNNTIVEGSGVQASKTFDVPPFSGIKVVGSTDVDFTQGPRSVVLFTDDNLIDYYEISVEGGILVVGVKSGTSISPETDDMVRISCPDISSVTLSGSGDINIGGRLKIAEGLSITLAGAGDIEAETVECKAFTVSLNGSGDIGVKSLTAPECSVQINGSGDVDIVCRNAGDISAAVNGSGDITLSGSARSVKTRVLGSGDVSTSGLTVSQGER
jgi:hypothetical protein